MSARQRRGLPGSRPSLAIHKRLNRLVMCQAPPTASITLSVIGIVVSSRSTALFEWPDTHLTARGLTQPEKGSAQASAALPTPVGLTKVPGSAISCSSVDLRMNTRASKFHPLLVASPVPKLVVDDESNQPCPMVHENIQGWLFSHVLFVVGYCVVRILAMIMAMAEQFSVNIPRNLHPG